MSKANEIDNIKTNFFYSANSEAYQDGFLSWIILNYNSNENPEIYKFSKYFIEKLLNDSNDGNTIHVVEEKVSLDRQVHDSDLIVIVNTNKGKHLIIIEDKVGSAIHSSNKRNGEKYATQLIKYFNEFLEDENYVDYILENRVHLYVYKNQFIDAVENEKITLSDKECSKLVTDLNYQPEIDDLSRKIYTKNKDGNPSKNEMNRDNKVRKLEKRKKIVEELKDKYIDDKIVQKKTLYTWNTLDIEEIYKLFNEYIDHKEENVELLNNVIFGSYFQMLKLWHDEYEKLEKCKYEKLEKRDYVIDFNSNTFDLLWYDRSWLWDYFFHKLTEELYGNCKMIKNSSDSKIDDGRVVYIEPAQGGYYWCWSLHLENKKNNILISARNIVEQIAKKKNDQISISIDINLSNPNYPGNKDIWKILDKNKQINEKGVAARNQHAEDIQKQIAESDLCKMFKKKEWTERKDKKLNNKVGTFEFLLNELSVSEISKVIKAVENLQCLNR